MPTAKRRGKQSESQPEPESDCAPCEHLKYPKPKILLIDMPPETSETLLASGYNISAGSFGRPYRVEMTDGFVPVVVNGSLPRGFEEQEIVVVDLAPRELLKSVVGEKYVPASADDWWASCASGVIDPRPRSMAISRSQFDRILSHGGVFIIFAEARAEQTLKWGHVYRGDLVLKDDIPFSNWSFLTILNDVESRRDTGEEITISDFARELTIGHALADYADGTKFRCTLHPLRSSVKERWFTLAVSKYDDPVAGMIVPKAVDHNRPGWILILPRVPDMSGLVMKLLQDVLPGSSPGLFPYAESVKWAHRHEYELPAVQELKQQIRVAGDEAEETIALLETQIEEERDRFDHLHDLLGQTGRPLVLAVKRSLEDLGFESVVDVDQELADAGESEPKREDLQIHDTSPILLVEVKGISGIPRDEDALQVDKYPPIRMREWHRTDVHGLSVINHQRHIPPLDRDNKFVFRDDLITNAEDRQLGLLTTWDLFRLMRGQMRYGWEPKFLKPIFYQVGRIEPVPTHYRYLGIIEHCWSKVSAISVAMENDELALGDTIAFELPVEFEEQVVESLRIEDEPVERAGAGQVVGLLTHLDGQQAKVGIRVFRVEPDTK